MSDIILAVDLGAGSLRAAAVTPRGRVVAAAARPLASHEPQPGWSEIDAGLWWRALAEAIGAVLDKLPRASRVAGFCIAGLTRSQVFLDAAGAVLRPAILFRDRRAAEAAEEASRYFAADNPAEAVTAFHPLARLAWLARREPALFDRVASVAEPKDYLNLRLTGRRAGDAVTCSRLDALAPSGPMPPVLRRGLDLLAVERLAPWSALGPVTCREAPFDRLAGVPVFAGSMDSWASAIGAGAVTPGQAYDIAGTSEVVGLITRERRGVAGLVSLLWGEAVHQIGGPTQAGADSARWCHETFRLRGGLASAIERAGALSPVVDRPLFLPYLAGERAPFWRADLRAAFHLVSRSHRPDDFLHAVLEGVAHAVRDILVRAASCAEAPHELRVCGGGARSDAWCQLKADITALPVLRVASRETGLLGCAVAAAFGLGIYPSLAAACAAMAPVARSFVPRAELADFHRARAESYRRAQAAVLEMVA